MRKFLVLIIVISAYILSAQEVPYLSSRDHAILVNAEVNNDDYTLTLKWQKNPLCTGGYAISRRENRTGDFIMLTQDYLDTNVFEYQDKNITPGVLYEYFIMAPSVGKINTKIDNKDTAVAIQFWATGYLSAGVDVDVNYQKGRVLLIVESELYSQLPEQVDRLRNDLKNEGWGVNLKTFGRTESFNSDSVLAVKQFIKDEYEKDNNVTSVFLLGRIAVPYSGRIVPDGHGNHVGAWPADLFYGQLDDGSWRDFQVNDKSASREQNHNVPGDGKYDMSQLPNGMDVTIAVGRVDFYDMPLFINDNRSELDMYENYLDMNHLYRIGGITEGGIVTKSKGIVDDNFGARNYTEGFASGGWRNIANLVGNENVTPADFLSTLKTDNYLWAYGTGGGTYTSAGGIGSSQNFADNEVNGVFTMLFGSYFGDWDSQNNFLRAPLAATPGALTCVWSGRPQWYFHHMAMGFPIGYSTMISQNNYNEYYPNVYQNGSQQQIITSGNRQIHSALMGDPTLVMFPSNIVEPPTNVTVVKYKEPTYRVEWEEPPTDDIKYYNIYRANEEFGAYTRLNDKPLEPGTTQYIDENVELEGELFYMVKTAKTIWTFGGGIFHESVGVTASILTGVENITAGDIAVTASPLPASEYVNISLTLPFNAKVKTTISDMNGNTLYTVADKYLTSGTYNYTWNFDQNIPNGVYIIQTLVNGEIRTNKLIINR
jgi:hypothetical protein